MIGDRLEPVWWHASCWIRESDRRAPELAAVRRRTEDRLAVAEMLLRQSERESRGFDVLGRRGVLEGYAADNER